MPLVLKEVDSSLAAELHFECRAPNWERMEGYLLVKITYVPFRYVATAESLLKHVYGLAPKAESDLGPCLNFGCLLRDTLVNSIYPRTLTVKVQLVAPLKYDEYATLWYDRSLQTVWVKTNIVEEEIDEVCNTM